MCSAAYSPLRACHRKGQCVFGHMMPCDWAWRSCGLLGMSILLISTMVVSAALAHEGS